MKKMTLMDGLSVDLDVVIEQVKETIEFEEWKEELSKLKGFDLWPFDDDGDEYITAFDEMRHNAEIIGDVILATINMVELSLASVVLLENPQKHAIVREILDDAIKLPFWAEWADGPMLDLLITLAVRLSKQTFESGNLVGQFNDAAMQAAGLKNQAPDRVGIELVSRQKKKEAAEKQNLEDSAE